MATSKTTRPCEYCGAPFSVQSVQPHKRFCSRSCASRRDRPSAFVGDAFGRLTLLERLPGKHAHVKWRCRCACGNEAIVRNDHLKTGAITSCGCAHAEMLRKRNTTHGKSGTPEWHIWKGMHTRCFNIRSKAWKSYGGRGITVCDEWRDDFPAFLRDMGERHSPELSIERRDNDGNYCKANCYWATPLEQSRNRRPYGRLKLAALAAAAKK